MPRVISDELFDQLTGCLRQQRLLGVMGMIERMEKGARFINEIARLRTADGYVATIFESITGEANAEEQQTDND